MIGGHHAGNGLAMTVIWGAVRTLACRVAFAVLVLTASSAGGSAFGASQLEDVIQDMTRQLLEQMQRGQSQPGQAPTQPHPTNPQPSLPGTVGQSQPGSQTQSVSSVEVTLNGTRPDGSHWDSTLGGLLVLNTREILPDLQICLAPATSGGWEDCGPVCKDNRTCRAQFSQSGMAISVYEVDSGGRETILSRHPVAGCSPWRLGSSDGDVQWRRPIERLRDL